MTNHKLILDDISGLDLSKFLKCGALMSTSDDRVLLGSFPVASSSEDPHAPCLYAPDFFLREENPWFVFENVFSIEKDKFKKALMEFPFSKWEITGEIPPSEDAFKVSFDRIMLGFKKDRWKKVVPFSVSYLDAATGPGQIARALARLIDLPKEHVPYGLWNENEGILGATPELLFEKSGNNVTSMAVAGTRKRGSKQMPLVDDAKQVEEHRVVVTSVQSVLEGFGEVTSEPLHVKTLLYLEHLCTKISVVLSKAASFEDLVFALHPTPALGANPRGSADDLFEDLEEIMPRKRFGAPFGWSFPNGDGVCTVAIRNAQWFGNRITLAAGCGVVPASRIDDEWAELQAKLESIRKILGILS